MTANEFFQQNSCLNFPVHQNSHLKFTTHRLSFSQHTVESLNLFPQFSDQCYITVLLRNRKYNGNKLTFITFMNALFISQKKLFLRILIPMTCTAIVICTLTVIVYGNMPYHVLALFVRPQRQILSFLSRPPFWPGSV